MKVGDKVKIKEEFIKYTFHQFKPNAIGVISEINDSGYYVAFQPEQVVNPDRKDRKKDGTIWFELPTERSNWMELVEDVKSVCECGNKSNPVGQGHSDWCLMFKKEF